MATELLTFFSTLQVWKDAGLLLKKDGIVRNGDSQPLIHRLADMIMGIASGAADERCSGELWSIDCESLKKVLWECTATISDTFPLGNISDALLDAVLTQCRKRLKAHKDRVYSVGLWRLRFGNIIQMLNTLLQHIGKPVHFSEVAEHASKWRPGFLERNAHATLDRSNNALLWDRGTFVHKDKVFIPHSLIHDVGINTVTA